MFDLSIYYDIIINTITKGGMMSRIPLTDGWIDIEEEGNTYYGVMAQEIMHSTNYIIRKTKEKFPVRLGVEPNFNECLRGLIKELTEREARN